MSNDPETIYAHDVAPGFITSATSEYEDAAADAYAIWQYRTGATRPYLHLSTTEQQAWREVAQFFLECDEDDDDPEDDEDDEDD
jgi:hypothetical protein